MADQEPDASLEERRNSYERKLDAKRDRLLERADKAEREGDTRINRASSDASMIPLGQPILVGHHSEKRDRNFRKRIQNNFSKGIELKEKASKLRSSRRQRRQGRCFIRRSRCGRQAGGEAAAARTEAGALQGDQQSLEKGRPHRQRRGAERAGGSATRPLPSSRLPTTPAGRESLPTFSATTTRTCAGSASGSRRSGRPSTTRRAKSSTVTFASLTTWRKTRAGFLPRHPRRRRSQQAEAKRFPMVAHGGSVATPSE